MPLHFSRTRRSLLGLLLLTAPVWLQAQPATPIPAASEDPVEITFRDESTDQVLVMLERLTGRSIIRPQALPAATFTFTSQRPMTRDEAILAIQSMLSINGIGVTPMGDMFLRVVPLARVRSEAPEFLVEPASNLPASGRVVSRLLELNFLRIAEIQTQLNLLLSPNGGSIIPFEKSNALLVTDTVSNIQAMEQLLARVDRPTMPRSETRFYPVRFARASELVSQIQAFTAGPGGVELGAGTMITADERTNQIILVADPRQMAYFENLIQRLDVQADLMTRNEVLPLKHADAVQVASLLSQLVTGSRSGMGATTRPGATPRPGQQVTPGAPGQLTPQQRQQQLQRQQQQQRQQQPQRPQQPGGPPVPGGGGRVGAQQAAEAVQAVVDEASTTDFSDTLTILADERSNSIIISGTRQDMVLIRELIEKIDVILAQVRIEVFIAEVTLSDSEVTGISALRLNYTEGGIVGGSVTASGMVLTRTNLDWTALFANAITRSDVKVLSVPTIVTTHNQEATILVGERRPIITGTLTDGSITGGSIRSQIQYENIGIELRVRPLIGADGSVQLQIDQKVDDVTGTVEIDGNDQPIIGTRHATSYVIVADRETVILGGLQSNSRRTSRNRLGILGQLPLIGDLFTSRTQDHNRTELLVFIRPTVLPTTAAAHRDAQEAIENHSQRDSIRESMNPSPFPTNLSPEALELRQRRLDAAPGSGAEVPLFESVPLTPDESRLSPEAIELRESNRRRQFGSDPVQ
jgi:general secretion pathway protein D